MPLIYDDPKKLQKMQQELFLMFEKHVFSEISKALPPGYTIAKYMYGMPDKKNTCFVRSSLPHSLFDQKDSNKILATLMNQDGKMECGAQKKAFRAMNVARMGHGWGISIPDFVVHKVKAKSRLLFSYPALIEVESRKIEINHKKLNAVMTEAAGLWEDQMLDKLLLCGENTQVAVIRA